MKLPLTIFVLVILGYFWVQANNDQGQSNSGLSADYGLVSYAEFVVRTAYHGKLESRHVVSITSNFQGTATVLELAAEGKKVGAGDLLVRFDSTRLQRELVNLVKEHALAESEYNSLIKAELPLEIQDLELKVLEAKGKLEKENKFLDGSLQLFEDKMISVGEVEEQKILVEGLTTKYKAAVEQLEMTRAYLHPAATQRSLTKLQSAQRTLELAREQLTNSVVLSPTAGVVAYKPLHVNGEYRTVRVGDSIFPNQPFIVIPDLDDMVVHIDIPEAELGRVRVDGPALIKPIAWPTESLTGRIETIASIAGRVPGQPDWQKYFHSTVGVEQGESRIRPGMSVTVYVLSYHSDQSLLVPRRAVRWDDDTASVLLREDDKNVLRPVVLGLSNETHYEIKSGLQAGDQVVLQ